MPVVKMRVQHDAVEQYLLENPTLQHGGIEPEAALLLARNCASGRSAVGLHVQIDGKDHLVKISLEMFRTISEVFGSYAAELYDEHRGP